MGDLLDRVPIETTGIRDVAYRLLRDYIITAKLMPGERLLEERLAGQLGISRTPLREALSRLQQEGLVIRLPSGGVKVAPVRREEILEIYAIRIALESQAARGAAERISADDIARLQEILGQVRAIPTERPVERVQAARRFHAGIARAARRPRLFSLLVGLWDEIVRFRIVNAMHRRDGADAEHTAILARLAAGDPRGAEAAMRRHLEIEQHLTMRHLSHPDAPRRKRKTDG